MTRVAPVFYIETALSMIIDIAVFHINFSTMQLTGLLIVIGEFLTMIVLA